MVRGSDGGPDIGGVRLRPSSRGRTPFFEGKIGAKGVQGEITQQKDLGVGAAGSGVWVTDLWLGSGACGVTTGGGFGSVRVEKVEEGSTAATRRTGTVVSNER